MRLGRDLGMKKKIVEATMAATMLLGAVLGQGVVANAEAVTPVATAKPTAAVKPTASVKPTATPVPIMRDNLSEFGLKKEVDLPVTVTADGLSYTLEKIMIFDAKSVDAQTLAKQYGYNLKDSKYFIWTKITVENKSGNIVQQNIKDLRDKWRLNFGDLSKGDAYTSMPDKMLDIKNSKQALWDWSLKPSEKLSSYQGYCYSGDINYFKIRVDNKSNSASKYIVAPKGN